ncbi:hypothetical protein DPMN_124050 [Dreissena polymorpha]|uniref:Uncharacterized protein n=1 Tax=Dreissena polymorpha TaxID=45954 RepID=A0A9D4JS55_DREPO|nr:hypothetical protein DPMN_124050 [Dreissena polymorpha]
MDNRTNECVRNMSKALFPHRNHSKRPENNEHWLARRQAQLSEQDCEPGHIKRRSMLRPSEGKLNKQCERVDVSHHG